MAEQLTHTVNQWGQSIGAEVVNWTSPLPPGIDVLEGQHVRLEHTQPEHHAQGLYHAFTADKDSRRWTYLPHGPFDPFADFRRWFEQVTETPDPRFYTILKRGEDTPLGLASYLRIKPMAGSIEVGHIHFSQAM